MNKLATDSYMHYMATTACSEQDKGFLLDEIESLEMDPHAPENPFRLRRYCNAIILPWKDHEIHWLPTKMQDGKEFSAYDRGEHNPEHDSIRYFNTISSRLKTTAFLKNIIIEDFVNTFGLSCHYLPIYVGIHLVKVATDNLQPGFRAWPIRRNWRYQFEHGQRGKTAAYTKYVRILSTARVQNGK